MTRAIKPNTALAPVAARSLELVRRLLPTGGKRETEALARFLVLKTLDAEWTQEVLALLARFPGAVERYAGLPLRGDAHATGTWGPFRQAVYALVWKHYVSALYLDSTGTFCPLRLRPLSYQVAVGGRVSVGRWKRDALLAKFGFEQDLGHYSKRLHGARLAGCLRKTEPNARVAERETLKGAERRIHKLVAQCCGERRLPSQPHLPSGDVRRASRARPSP